jgi:hypothetical protein
MRIYQFLIGCDGIKLQINKFSGSTSRQRKAFDPLGDMFATCLQTVLPVGGHHDSDADRVSIPLAKSAGVNKKRKKEMMQDEGEGESLQDLLDRFFSQHPLLDMEYGRWSSGIWCTSRRY